MCCCVPNGRGGLLRDWTNLAQVSYNLLWYNAAVDYYTTEQSPMENNYQEWLKQADYDMETADIMFANGRYFYAVFMCHLAIEKARMS